MKLIWDIIDIKRIKFLLYIDSIKTYRQLAYILTLTVEKLVSEAQICLLGCNSAIY